MEKDHYQVLSTKVAELSTTVQDFSDITQIQP